MSKPEPFRKAKTPRQRAEEALGVAQRRVDKLTKDRDNLVRDLKAVEKDLEAAARRLDYVAANPDLPQKVEATS